MTHEVTADGANWFGQNKDPGNTDETVKFPSTVALIWRWTGDDALPRRDVRLLQAQPALRRAHARRGRRRLARGARQRRARAAWARRSSTTPSTAIRGLYDLADMAQSKGDGATGALGAARRPTACASASRARGGCPRRACTRTRWARTTRRSSSSTGSPSTPMEAELTVDRPAGARPDHVRPRRRRRSRCTRRPCFSGERPFNRGLFHTGCGGGPNGAGRADDLLAQHRDPGRRRGQLRPPRRRSSSSATPTPTSRPSSASRPRRRARRAAGRDAGDPAVAGLRPEHRPLLDLPRDVHAGVGQLRHGLAGRAPAARRAPGHGPRARSRSSRSCRPPSPIAGSNIRLGTGALKAVQASQGRRPLHDHGRHGLGAGADARLGATLPRGSKVESVTLDGKKVGWQQRTTNRGLEVTTKTGAGRHTVVVTAR